MGDRLGTRIGKARLSFLRMRPRRTALVFTAITGSLISALSFTLLITINARWRRGLFDLARIEESLQVTREDLGKTQQTLESIQDALVTTQEGFLGAERRRKQAEAEAQELTERGSILQTQVQELRQTITALDGQRQQLLNENELLEKAVGRQDQERAELEEEIDRQRNVLADLGRSITALRRGDVAIASNDPIAMAKVELPSPADAPVAISSLLNRANQLAHERLRLERPSTKQIIRIPSSEVERITRRLQGGGAWIVTIRSANNVLLGEESLLAFADVRPSRQVLKAGQTLASAVVEEDERSLGTVNQRLSLLLATARNQANQLGVLNPQTTFDDEALTALIQSLVRRTEPRATLEAFSMEDSETGDPLRLGIRWLNPPPGDAPKPDYG